MTMNRDRLWMWIGTLSRRKYRIKRVCVSERALGGRGGVGGPLETCGGFCKVWPRFARVDTAQLKRRPWESGELRRCGVSRTRPDRVRRTHLGGKRSGNTAAVRSRSRLQSPCRQSRCSSPGRRGSTTPTTSDSSADRRRPGRRRRPSTRRRLRKRNSDMKQIDFFFISVASNSTNAQTEARVEDAEARAPLAARIHSD